MPTEGSHASELRADRSHANEPQASGPQANGPHTNAAGLFRGELAERWDAYLAKAAVLIAVLALIGRFAPVMPPLCLAAIWSLLSIASAVGVSYHFVIKKARNRYGLKGGGVVSRVNSGRTARLILTFVLSAAFVGGLILELPKWELAEWLMLVFAVPAYMLIYRCVARFMSREYEPLLQVSRTVMASSGILCVILLAVYLVISLAEPTVAYSSMTEAFLGAKQPFENSPSALLADAGYLTALVDGLTAFAMSHVAEGSFAVYVAWRVVLCFSAAAAIANLIGSCSLEFKELKLLFLPLDAVDDISAGEGACSRESAADGEGAVGIGAGVSDSVGAAIGAAVGASDGDGDSAVDNRATGSKKRSTRPLVVCVATACILPVVLFTCFAVADAKVAEVAATEEYTAAKAFVRGQVGMAAYIIDGKPYDYEKVNELYDRARELSEELAAEREAALVPLINEVCDLRLANVDAYLDWYYSLPADYDRLLKYFTGSIEEDMKNQLAERINEGIDESALDEALGYYMEKSLELESDIQRELAKYELSEYGLEDMPDWLLVTAEPLEEDFLAQPLKPTQQFLDTGERMGLSVGVGVVAGIVATKATEKILAKPFFRKIVASLVEKLAARGLLAAGGTMLAPGVGTAVGVGVGFVGDFLFLKADEALNRDAYREEIVAAIEESRQEMLDMVAA